MIKVFFRQCGETYGEQHAAAYKLLYAAAAFCGYEVSSAEIKRTDMGKPYFPDRSDLFFSLSHSGRYAVCAIGDIPCGVDIEKNREIPHRVCDRYLGGAAGKNAICRWTMRESFGKIGGGGFFKGDNIPDDAVFGFFEYEDYFMAVCACGYDGAFPIYRSEQGIFIPAGYMKA